MTFTCGVDFALARVASLTFIDRSAFGAFAFVLATLAAVAALHVLLQAGHDRRARRLQARARSPFPLDCLVTVAAFAFSSFA